MFKHSLYVYIKIASLRIILRTCLWLIFLTIGLACLLLTACTVGEEVAVVTLTLTLTPTVTITETTVPPTPTPTHTDTPTVIATPLPPATKIPKPTITPSSTPVPTQEPTVTPPAEQVITLPNQGTDQAINLEFVNQIGGPVTAVAVQNNLAYLGIGSRLAVADVSDPTQPRVIGWSGILPSIAEQIIIREGLAYVAMGADGLWIFDLSDPTTIKPVGHTQTTNPALNFVLQDNLAYAVDTRWSRPALHFVLQDNLAYTRWSRANPSVNVVNVSDPYQPAEISTLPLPVQAKKLMMVNGYLYVEMYPNHVDYENTLWVVDVSDPYQPTMVTAVPELAGFDMAPLDENLVVAEGGTLIIADISDPIHPTKLIQSPIVIDYGRIDTILPYKDTFISLSSFGDLGYCGGQISILAISQPDHFSKLSDLPTRCNVYDMTVADDLLYLAKGDGLSIWDISDLRMTYIGEIPTFMTPDFLAAGDDLYGIGSIDDEHTIYTFDLRDPTQPQVVGQNVYDIPALNVENDGPNQIRNLIADESRIYLASAMGGIAALDMIDPTNPQETAVTSAEDIGHETFNLVLSKDHLYALLDGNLGIFDAATLQRIGGVALEGKGLGIIADNDTLWMRVKTTEDAGLKVMDITNPTQLEEISFIDHGWEDQYILAVDQGFLYAMKWESCDLNGCSGEKTLRIIDTTDPLQMKTVAILPTTFSIGDMILSGDLLVLTGDDIWVVDISDPTQPHFVGYFPTPGYVYDAVMIDNLIYVADGGGGLLVLRLVE